MPGMMMGAPGTPPGPGAPGMIVRRRAGRSGHARRRAGIRELRRRQRARCDGLYRYRLLFRLSDGSTDRVVLERERLTQHHINWAILHRGRNDAN